MGEPVSVEVEIPEISNKELRVASTLVNLLDGDFGFYYISKPSPEEKVRAIRYVLDIWEAKLEGKNEEG